MTTMQMDEGLDTGDMLLRREIPIEPSETGGSLFNKLSELGSRLILETLKEVEAGSLTPIKQPEKGMTYAGMLTKEMGNISWQEPAEAVERLIRGLSPWPGTFSHLGGKLLKIHRAALVPEAEQQRIEGLAAGEGGQAGGLLPGALIREGDRLYVLCGKGMLELLELQLEGKKRMETADFLRGSGALIREQGQLTAQ